MPDANTPAPAFPSPLTDADRDARREAERSATIRSLMTEEMSDMPEDGDEATCSNCGENIEYNSDNEPPWTHTETGYSDCLEDGESNGFHAEPTTF